MWLTAGLCCFLWGSAFPAVKAGYKLLEISADDTASIILFAGVRFTLAGVLTLVIFSFINRGEMVPKKSSLKKICILSQFQTVLQYIFFYIGLAYTTGERGSVINATSVFFALFISALIFKMEKISVKKLLGSLIGFAGVILVSLDALGSGSSGLKGELFILISSVSYAFSSVFMKRFSKDDNPAMLSGWQFILGGAVMSVFGFAFGGRINNLDVKSVLIIVYLAFVSATAYSLWSILLKNNEVSKVAVCGFMIPVFGFILSAIFAGEGFSSGVLGVAALILVALGIIVVNTDNNLATKNY